MFASSAFFLPLAEELAKKYRVTVPDLLGFGASPKPNIEYTVEDHLRFVKPLLNADPGPWIVVAHSAGGALAIQLAIELPQTVRSVVLFNVPIYSSPERRDEIFQRHDLLTRVSLRNRLVGRVICETSCFFAPVLERIAPRLRTDVPSAVASDYFRHSWKSYTGTLRSLILARNMLDDLSRVPQPVLVVQGSDDPLADHPDRIAWPGNVQLLVVPQSDHASFLLRQADRAADIVQKFTGGIS